MIGSILHNAVTPIGVDLGASGARLLQLRCATGRSAVIAATRADAGGEADDEARLGALAQQIARRLDTGAFRGRRCVVSLDDRALRVKSMRLPAMSDEETDQAVRVDGAERLGFAPEQAEIGWIRAGEVRQGDEAKEEIILVGASREHVERVIESVSAVGLVPLAIEPGFQACARAIGRQRRRKGEREQTHLLVDVGSRASGVALIRGDRVAFYKQIEWGGTRSTPPPPPRSGSMPPPCVIFAASAAPGARSTSASTGRSSTPFGPCWTRWPTRSRCACGTRWSRSGATVPNR